MHLIWHGTAAIEAVCGGGRILLDPFVPLKGSPVKVCIAEYDGFSDIFVTYCHFDHVANLPEIVRRNPGVLIHCTQAAYAQLQERGHIPERNLRLLRFGDQISVKGFTVRLCHGKHALLPKADVKRVAGWLRSPARGNIPRLVREFYGWNERDESVFYVLEAEGKRVALMGSMNLREEIAYPTGVDVLVLPYNGWTDNLPPAKRIIERLAPKRVLLDHYDDSFPPLSAPVDTAPIVEAFPGLVEPMILRQREIV